MKKSTVLFALLMLGLICYAQPKPGKEGHGIPSNETAGIDVLKSALTVTFDPITTK